MPGRKVAVGDSRRGIDGGVGSHGRCVDYEAALLHGLARQVVVGVVALCGVARHEVERDAPLGEHILHGLRCPARTQYEGMRGLFAPEQAVEGGPQADDIGIVSHEA